MRGRGGTSRDRGRGYRGRWKHGEAPSAHESSHLEEWSRYVAVLSKEGSSVESLDEVMDGLLSLPYGLGSLSVGDVSHAISKSLKYASCSSAVSPVSFKRKIFRWWNKLFVEQKVAFSPEHGYSSMLVEFLQFLLNVVHDAKATREYTTMALRTMSYLLFQNSSYVREPLLKEVLDTLIPFSREFFSLSDPSVPSEEDNEPDTVRRMSVSCLGNLCLGNNPEMKKYYSSLFEILFSNFVEISALFLQNSSLYKMQIHSMRALEHVVTALQDDTVQSASVSTLSSLVRPIIFYERTISANGFSSDSDVGSSASPRNESGKSSNRMNEVSRIRMGALSLLNAVARMKSKPLQSVWPSLLPDCASTSPKPFRQSLSTILLYDKTAALRGAAARVIGGLVEGTKQYLSQADDRPIRPDTRFTTRPQVIGCILTELHRTFVAAVNGEVHLGTLIHILKALGTLVVEVPYKKLTQKHMKILIPCLERYLSVKDNNVLISTMSVFGKIFKTNVPLKEISEILNEELFDKFISIIKSSRGGYNLSVRQEAWFCLGQMAHSYPKFCSSLWESKIFPFVLSVMKERSRKDSVSSLSFLDEFTSTTHSRLPETIWKQIISDILPLSLGESSVQMRVIGCNILRNLKCEDFEDIPVPQRLFCLTQLLAMAEDDSGEVRMASVRALGEFVSFSSLREDFQFVYDVVDILKKHNSQTSSSNVRVKAFWSLANLSDGMRNSSLFLNLFSSDVEGRKEALDLFIEVLDMSLMGCTLGDKIRCNSVRAVGNIGNFVGKDLLLDSDQKYFNSITEVIANCFSEGGIKVRWNAGYALANFLSNPGFKSGCLPQLPPFLADKICSCLLQDDNFKVRIQATSALVSIPNRMVFGTSFRRVWSVIVECLEMVDTSRDYTEYQYNKSLICQLRRAFVHLTLMLENSDSEWFLLSVKEKLPQVVRIVNDVRNDATAEERTSCSPSRAQTVETPSLSEDVISAAALRIHDVLAVTDNSEAHQLAEQFKKVDLK